MSFLICLREDQVTELFGNLCVMTEKGKKKTQTKTQQLNQLTWCEKKKIHCVQTPPKFYM